MTIFAVMVPALILATMEDVLRVAINKANEIIDRIIYKRNVRERRSRSQRRWA